MANCVVDTSVAVKWALNEPDSADAARFLIEVSARGDQVYLLDLALIEAANAIWVRAHRGLLTPTEADTALSLLRQAPVHSAASCLTDAFALALRFDIAVYDAVFVAAVQQHGCEGVTADAPLVQAIRGAFPSIKLLRDW